MRTNLLKLELGFWIYGLESVSAIVGPKLIFSPYILWVEVILMHWIHLLILDKVRPCLSKLELGFWTYRLLIVTSFGPGPKLVFRPQTPDLRFILFLEIIRFLFEFWIKQGLVCEN